MQQAENFKNNGQVHGEMRMKMLAGVMMNIGLRGGHKIIKRKNGK